MTFVEDVLAELDVVGDIDLAFVVDEAVFFFPFG
jgi:hypothetical protein